MDNGNGKSSAMPTFWDFPAPSIAPGMHLSFAKAIQFSPSSPGIEVCCSLLAVSLLPTEAKPWDCS